MYENETGLVLKPLKGHLIDFLYKANCSETEYC